MDTEDDLKKKVFQNLNAPKLAVLNYILQSWSV